MTVMSRDVAPLQVERRGQDFFASQFGTGVKGLTDLFGCPCPRFHRCPRTSTPTTHHPRRTHARTHAHQHRHRHTHTPNQNRLHAHRNRDTTNVGGGCACARLDGCFYDSRSLLPLYQASFNASASADGCYSAHKPQHTHETERSANSHRVARPEASARSKGRERHGRRGQYRHGRRG